ncbi:LuxR C-terminal-related transcriptional regulator [Streptomyces sp. V4-01]|uniref:LuxR C-terminal-related transcriptional regulator n=1 Tax=Actinacidiphila polyblastidii TaxID=3110430 RepID=A0ABU7PFG0_9ACTN|nr:LuxR C-terminal-related transcriptional regulator [Streptomyces sp. V4-01]
MTERPFEALGLSADADRAYPLLISTRGVAAAELARHLGVLGEQAESACGELAARGLAKRGADGLWYPLPPQAGLLPMVSRAEEQLRQGRELLDRLGVVYQRVHEGHRAEEIVQPVQGAAAIRGRVHAVHAAARKELLFFSRGGGAVGGSSVGGGSVGGVGQPAADPAVRRRVLVERDGLDAGFTFGPAHVRVVERLPVRLCIADRSVALLPLAEDGEPPDPVALEIGPSGLLDALVALFESLWAGGVPLGPPHSGVRLRILGMLVSGSTDAAMARALGVAVRTVQRHIAAMQRAAGADNRVQLVWHAARHGWLDV